MFIAQKISKIQADHDATVELHDTRQKDSAQYSDRRILLQLYNQTGNNCFEWNPDKVQTYDIEIDKIAIDGITDTSYSIFHSYMQDKGNQYFIAIDNQGWIYLLHNFWTDEFNRFVRKKYGIEKGHKQSF